ncbi:MULTISPECIES: hypothetical protein [unclassified Undibacterium]|uniref:hypothetical protein n=1 Tax=unclassified Undibacterium TaxID=2630295 RepID=UPI003C2F6B24
MRDNKTTDDGRWPLSKFLIVGILIAVAGYLPLQLYIIFGPADGNPVGLGLLMVMGMMLGMMVVAIGVIKRLIRHFFE